MTPSSQAPEVFRGDQSYGSPVDVYSFGIIMWEISTRQKPWSDLGDDASFIGLIKLLTTALQTGRRPKIPAALAKAQGMYVEAMEQCWGGDPAERPSFAEVAQILGRCIQEHQRCTSRPRVDCSSSDSDMSTSLTRPLLDAPW